MPDYDFKSLSDTDFESLSVDLMSEVYDHRFERFKAGRDGGIDGRFFVAPGAQQIIQCKHWARSGVKQLIAALRSKELPKVQRLKPVRYILVTSLELSATDKREIASIFHPFMVSESDVYGKEDLNQLLGRYRRIEESHYKLWLQSASVLSIIANCAVVGRSDFTLNQIHKRSDRFVQTSHYKQALEKLREHGVILITGEPGVGKTTLAEQICLDHAIQQYELCVASDKVEELESVYRDKAHQIFYFDDFLGRNFLEVLERHEDSKIVNFIKRVRLDKQKRFVLTSRTTVINKGKSLTDLFKIEHVDRHEFEINVQRLSQLEKARILHNSIWFSGLPAEYIEQITKDQRYRQVIDHRSFNPRLISFITDPERLGRIAPTNYWAYILSTLNNPADVWEPIYDGQLTDYGRCILLLLVFSGGSMTEESLRAAYARMISLNSSTNYRGDADYSRCIRPLIGSVINRTIDRDSARLHLFNPSIADYVLQRVRADVTLITAIFSALSTTESVFNLQRLVAGKIITDAAAASTVERLFQTCIVDSSEPMECERDAVVARLALRIFPNDQTKTSQLVTYMSWMKKAAQFSSYGGHFAEILRKCEQAGALTAEAAAALIDDLDPSQIEYSQYDSLIDLGNSLGDAGMELRDLMKRVIVESLADNIQSEAQSKDELSEFTDIYDVEEAEVALRAVIFDMLAEHNLQFTDDDVDQIASSCSITDIIERNIESASRDYDGVPERGTVGNVDPIDDLFNFDAPPPH